MIPDAQRSHKRALKTSEVFMDGRPMGATLKTSEVLIDIVELIRPGYNRRTSGREC